MHKIEMISTRMFFGLVTLLVAIMALGMSYAKNQKTQIFVAKTNNFVIGKYGDVLVTKTYDPKTKSFDRDRTTLISVGQELVLEERKVQMAEK